MDNPSETCKAGKAGIGSMSGRTINQLAMGTREKRRTEGNGLGARGFAIASQYPRACRVRYFDGWGVRESEGKSAVHKDVVDGSHVGDA